MRPINIVFCFYLLLITSTNAQVFDNVTLLFTPDDFPQDLRFSLYDDRYELIAESDLAFCFPFTQCQRSYILTPSSCYRLLITDKQVDDDSEPIDLAVIVNRDTLVQTMVSDSIAVFNFACELGFACEQAVVFKNSEFRKKWPPVSNYWFSYTAPVTGLYEISNCDLDTIKRRYPETNLWIYEECQAIVNNGPEGAFAFSQEYSICPPSSGLNAIPLTGGQTYYLRMALNNNPYEVWEDSISLQIKRFSDNPGCMDPKACNYYPLATKDDGSCFYNNCAPDLEINQEEFEKSIHLDTVFQDDQCLIEEGCLRGPGKREVIRFSTLIKNVGNADYIIGAPELNSFNFSNDNCHQHFHHLGYAEYLLFEDGGQRQPIGFKNGFCVQDSQCPDRVQKYFCNYMGISVGCEDKYGSELACQWVDITDISDGIYTLVIRINWNRFPDIRGMYEENYDNNWAQVCLNIDRSSGETIVSQLENCTVYQDCLGEAFGAAEIDCSGVCGGAAHFGDLNSSGELESGDISEYTVSLLNQSIPIEPCFDLNADGDISIYDIILARECLEENRTNKDNLFHDHCTLPAGQFNVADSFRIEISGIDTVMKSISLDYISGQSPITALQIDFTGIDIQEVIFEGIEPVFYFNDHFMYAFFDEEGLKRSNDFTKLMRIAYRTIESPGSICINDIEVINTSNQEIVSFGRVECAWLTSNSNLQSILALDIFPNPAIDMIHIDWQEITPDRIDLMNLAGQIVRTLDSIGQQGMDISVEHLPKGVYVLRISYANRPNYNYKLIIQ